MLLAKYWDVAVVITVLGSLTWFLLWRYFGSIERCMNDVKADIKLLFSNTVTRNECAIRHAEMMSFFKTLVSCQHCKENGKGEGDEV